MIEDPLLQQLVNATSELMTLQALAVWLQNHRDMHDDLDSVLDTFNAVQHQIVEAMSQRIVELALLESNPPSEFERETGTDWMNPDVHHD